MNFRLRKYGSSGALALTLLAAANPAAGLARAKALAGTESRALASAALQVTSAAGGTAEWPTLRQRVASAEPAQLGEVIPALAAYMTATNDMPSFQQGVDLLKGIGIKYKAQGADAQIAGLLQQLKEQKAGQPSAAAAGQIVDRAVAELQPK